MHAAFYAACTALDAFLSRAAINRRNIQVEAREYGRARPRDDSPTDLCVVHRRARARAIPIVIRKGETIRRGRDK